MFQVAAFYRFARLSDVAGLREGVRAALDAAGVRGSVLLAPEGINGTMAGSPDGVAAALAHLRGLPGCADMPARLSDAAAMPFGRLKVRLKREIVTMGQPGLDPASGAGRPVEPGDWNAVLADPGTVAIDVRNSFEVAIGSFKGALDPGTVSFGDFPSWWDANAEALAGRRVAMFCTGGIRCEKSTALLRARGVADVVHLRGGILGYLEAVPAAESLWRGGCFVFDERVSVGHGLRADGHVLCRACRRPVTRADTVRPEWEAGVCCHLCAGDRDGEDRARLRERTRQVGLAAARGELHIGR